MLTHIVPGTEIETINIIGWLTMHLYTTKSSGKMHVHVMTLTRLTCTESDSPIKFGIAKE